MAPSQDIKLLKDALKAPRLLLPNCNKSFILTINASSQSITYILSQLDNQGTEHPIAYNGRSLKETETKWHITKQEGLALVEAVQLYRPYLTNNSFTVFADYISVRWLKQVKNRQGQLRRWAKILQGFNFKFVQKPGAAIGRTDGISRPYTNDRVPCGLDDGDGFYTLDTHPLMGEVTSIGDQKSKPQSVMPATCTATESEQQTNKMDLLDKGQPGEFKELIYLQRKCPSFQDIIKYMVDKEVPQDPASARRVVADSSQYVVGNQGLLWHLYTPRTKGVNIKEKITPQLALPTVMRDATLRSLHNSLAGGHQGLESTYAALRCKYYWPSMYADTENYIRSCEGQPGEYENLINLKRDIQGTESNRKPPQFQDREEKKNKKMLQSKSKNKKSDRNQNEEIEDSMLPTLQDYDKINEPNISTIHTSNSQLSASDNIDHITSSKREGSMLYYFIKWKDPGKPNTLEYADSIPSTFIREYHSKNTMSGKKRKRPLHHHKFFETRPTAQSVNIRGPMKHDQMVGYKENYSGDKCSWLLHSHNYGINKSQPVNEKLFQRMRYISPYIDSLFNLLKTNIAQEDWHSKTGFLDDGASFSGKMVREVFTCDPADINTTYFKVFQLDSNTPSWLTIHQVPPHCLRQFLFRMRIHLYR